MKQKEFKLIAKLFAFVFLAAIGLLSSCNPEGFKPSPGNYIIQGQQDTDPAFSPNGNLIAYAHWADTAKNYPNGLYVINKDGGNRRLVLAGSYFNSPSWSPNGDWLAASSGQLLKCKINGDSLTVFSGLNNLKYPEFYFPSWTKDGRYILFDKPLNPDGGLYYMRSDFSHGSRIFGLEVLGRDPELSPSGKYFLYERGGVGIEHGEIFLQDTTGVNETQLTQNRRDNRGPSWSPDGQKIVWSGNLHLSTMNADGTGQKDIEYGSNPSWSIYNEIVYSHANADYSKEVLYIISPDGKK